MNEQSLYSSSAVPKQKSARRMGRAGGRRPLESVMQMIFFICGFIAIAFVLVITIYLIISGLPAIREIGLVEFLFGTKWASTAAEPTTRPPMMDTVCPMDWGRRSPAS